MKVLVIHEVIPEETNVAIVEMSDELYEQLKPAHGYTVNNEEVIKPESEVAVLAIDNAFCKNPEYYGCCESELGKSVFMKFSDINGTDESRDLSGVEAMIHCSFML